MAIFRRKRQTREVDPYPDGELAYVQHPEQFRAPIASTAQPNQTAIYQTGALGGWDSGNMRSSPFNPERAINDHYLANTVLYAAVRALAEDVTSLTLRVGADPNKPESYNTNHPLLQRLGPRGMPNPETTAAQLLKWTIAQYIVTGRFAWEVDQGDGSFWPLVSTRVNPIPTTGGANYFRRFDYDIGQGKKKELRPDQVVYHWRPSANDWRVAESVLQSARLDLEVAVMQDLYDVAFLRNDARPAAIIVHERIENDDERDAFRRNFLDTHRGARNAGKVAFAEADPDGAPAKEAIFVQTLGISQRDGEFIKRYQQKTTAILFATGVPRSRIGDTSERTFSNAAEEIKIYWRNAVRQLAIDLASAITLRCMPLYGNKDVAWFDFTENEYLQEPRKVTLAEAVSGDEGRLLTVEEARVEGFQLTPAPLPGMGKLEPPAPEPLPTTVPIPAPPPTKPPLPEPPPPASATLAEIRATVLEALKAGRSTFELTPPPIIEVTEHVETADEARERRANQWRSFDSQTKPLEKRWTRRVQRHLDAQRDAVIARITGKRGRQALKRDTPEDPIEVDAVFDKAFWQKQAQELGLDLHEDATGAAFKAFEASVGIAFDVESPFAKDFILKRAKQLAGNITDTTYEGIKEALVEGVKAGESIPDLADRIRGLFDQTYANRAETVARTEVISGYNGSTTEAATQTDGVVTDMEWISTLDDRTRGNNPKDEFDHLIMDGVTVAVGEAFDVGGESLDYPGDPSGSPGNVINCRCTTAPVVSEDAGAGRGSNVVPIDRVARLAVAIHRGECRVTNGRRAMNALAH